ncbi:MAG: hypothetical protein IV086_05675 [Hyphomonadaceae bacterium]|nr:MAG: hypothetical protein FD160_154 [Caulobacteraceae bacterium]MBT9445168.1 hypothetical protein [Hyphomonadaceae bacterium]TPW07706.1 MAG: hypothetical protein FD124_931 [Alphaproteobacteria bacterium]
MNRGVEGAEIELMGVAIAAGLLALLAPAATAILLACGIVHVFLTNHLSDRGDMDLAPLMALAGIAFGAAAYGAPGAIGAALVWRSAAEIGRSRETQGLSEPLWLAIAYRWAPLSAALLFRLDAPPEATLAVTCVAAVALGDWALRRLAEWRLDAPQPFDTAAYLGSQARVLALVFLIPDAFASLTAFVTLTIARNIEAPRAASPRYAAAL